MTRRCQNCGAHVTRDFARVFGDNNDDVHACRECADFPDLAWGAAGGVSSGPRSGPRSRLGSRIEIDIERV